MSLWASSWPPCRFSNYRRIPFIFLPSCRSSSPVPCRPPPLCCCAKNSFCIPAACLAAFFAWRSLAAYRDGPRRLAELLLKLARSEVKICCPFCKRGVFFLRISFSAGFFFNFILLCSSLNRNILPSSDETPTTVVSKWSLLLTWCTFSSAFKAAWLSHFLLSRLTPRFIRE